MTQPPDSPQQWWQPQGPPSGPQPQQPYPQPHQNSGFGGSFSAEYGGFGAFEEQSDPSTRRTRSRKPWIITAIAITALAGGGTAAWLSGVFTGKVLDQPALHDGITTTLTDSYGEHDVSNVACPADQQITTGHTFDCTVDIAGKQKTVTIRVLNAEPQYEVGAPH